MATIGILDVGIRAKTTDFEKGLNRAMKQLNSFGSAVQGVVAFAGLAIGFRAIQSAIGKTMEAIDKMAKASDSLGITTEALAGLHLQAELAGVGIEGIDSALGKLSRSLADAATNGGPAALALQSIGLTAANLVNMDPARAFRSIADGVSRIQNPAQRAQAVVALFGKSGQALIPMLNEGAAGFDLAAEKAERYGLAISRIDASIIEQVNDQITDMGAAWDGMKQQLVLQLAPAFIYIIELIKDVAVAIVGTGSDEIEVFDLVAAALQGVANVVNTIRVAYYAMKTAVLRFTGELLNWVAVANNAFNGFAQSIMRIVNTADKGVRALLAAAATAAALDPTGLSTKSVAGARALYDALAAPALKAADAVLDAKVIIDNHMMNLSQDIIGYSYDAAEETNKAWNKIGDGSVLKRLAEIRAELEAEGLKAQQMAEFSKGGLFDSAGKNKNVKDAPLGSFMEIALSRTALTGRGAGSSKQEVHDAATEKQVGISQTIAATLANIQSQLQIG